MKLAYTDKSGIHYIEIENPNSNPEILEKISYLKDRQLNAILNLQITEHTSRHELMNYIHILIFVYNGKKKDIEDLLKQNNLQANNLIAFQLLDRRKTLYKEMCKDDNFFKTFINEYKGQAKDQMKRECKKFLVKFLTELRNDNKYWIEAEKNTREKIQEIQRKTKQETLNKFVNATDNIREIENSNIRNFPKIERLDSLVRKFNTLDIRNPEQTDESAKAIREMREIIQEINSDPEIQNFDPKNPKINPQSEVYKTFLEIIDYKNQVEEMLNDFEQKIRASFNKNKANNQSSSNNPKTTVQVNSIEQGKQKAEKLQKEISDKKQSIESFRALSKQLDNGINDLEKLYKNPSSTEEQKNRILAKIQEANNKKQEVNQRIQELEKSLKNLNDIKNSSILNSVEIC